MLEGLQYAAVEVAKRPPEEPIPCMNPYCSVNLGDTELCQLLGPDARRKAKQREAVLTLDARSLEWARRTLRLCPACLEPIEKNGGVCCMHPRL